MKIFTVFTFGFIAGSIGTILLARAAIADGGWSS